MSAPPAQSLAPGAHARSPASAERARQCVRFPGVLRLALGIERGVHEEQRTRAEQRAVRRVRGLALHERGQVIDTAQHVLHAAARFQRTGRRRHQVQPNGRRLGRHAGGLVAALTAARERRTNDYQREPKQEAEHARHGALYHFSEPEAGTT